MKTRYPDNAAVAIRDISKSDMGPVADVHAGAFAESALTHLGREAVKRYYIWQLEGPHPEVRAVGAFDSSQCLGFCFSGVFNGSTSGFVRRNRMYLALSVLIRPWLLFSPIFLHRAKSAVRFIRRRTPKAVTPKKENDRTTDSYGILSIAVAPASQGLGIGKALMQDAELAAIRSGFKKMHLTVNPGNKSSIAFYELLGWEKWSDGPAWEGFMVKALHTSEAASAASVSGRQKL